MRRGAAHFMSLGTNAGYRSDTDGSKLIKSLLQLFHATISVLWCGAFHDSVCVYRDFYFWKDFKLQNTMQIVL